jgi:hypothetical protein
VYLSAELKFKEKIRKKAGTQNFLFIQDHLRPWGRTVSVNRGPGQA